MVPGVLQFLIRVLLHIFCNLKFIVYLNFDNLIFLSARPFDFWVMLIYNCYKVNIETAMIR